MMLHAQIIEVVEEKFTGKRGPQVMKILVCMDISEVRLRNTVDYICTDEDWNKVQRALPINGEAVLKAGIKEVANTSFAGRLRLRGEIREIVNGPKKA